MPKVLDVKVWGEFPDIWQLITSSSSESQGWEKSTYALEIPAAGCLVNVCSKYRDEEGRWIAAESTTFVPGVKIRTQTGEDGTVKSRRLILN